MMHGWEYGGWMPMGLMWIGGFLWILTVLAIAALVFYAVQRFTHPRRTSKAALDLLEQAYARGEIKREEFMQKRADLLG